MTPKNIFSSLLVTVLLFQALVVPNGAFANKHKPTLAQIEAAKKAELEKKRLADEALKRLAKAKGNLRALTAIAKAADLKYQKAKLDLDVAVTQAKAALESFQEASAAVSATHKEIGKLAVNAYVSGGGLSDLEAVLSASGPQEIMDRLSTLENLGSGNKTALKRFKVAEAVAQRAKVKADIAKENQRIVTERVAATKKEADDARAEQQREVDKLQAVQDKLQRDLATAKKIRLTLEQKRQLAILEEVSVI